MDSNLPTEIQFQWINWMRSFISLSLYLHWCNALQFRSERSPNLKTVTNVIRYIKIKVNAIDKFYYSNSRCKSFSSFTTLNMSAIKNSKLSSILSIQWCFYQCFNIVFDVIKIPSFLDGVGMFQNINEVLIYLRDHQLRWKL